METEVHQPTRRWIVFVLVVLMLALAAGFGQILLDRFQIVPFQRPIISALLAVIFGLVVLTRVPKTIRDYSERGGQILRCRWTLEDKTLMALGIVCLLVIGRSLWRGEEGAILIQAILGVAGLFCFIGGISGLQIREHGIWQHGSLTRWSNIRAIEVRDDGLLLIDTIESLPIWSNPPLASRIPNDQITQFRQTVADQISTAPNAHSER